jgi:phage shock protein C
VNSPRTTLYTDKKNGKIMGVCAGIADYTGINVLWVRLGAVCVVAASWGTALPAYFIAGALLNRKPAEHYVDDKQEQKYWQGVRQSPKRTAREIRAHFRDIDRRLADVESYYVSNNPRLSAEIERLR